MMPRNQGTSGGQMPDMSGGGPTGQGMPQGGN